MGDGPEYEATRGSYWQSIENRRKAGIAAAIAVAVLGVAGVLALAATRPPAGEETVEATGTIIPAEETTETTPPVLPGSDEAAGAVAEPAADPGTVPAATPTYMHAALVAYRRDGWLCVAAEDGTGERKVVASASGVHSLSPDGGALAFVDAGSGALAIADVAAGAVVTLGPALQDPPSWSPDSAWLVYTASGPKVMRVGRDGAGTAGIFSGSMPSVSVADGTVAGVSPGGEIVVWRQGTLSKFRVSRAVTGLATDGATVYFGAMAADGPVSLRAISTDGRGERTLVGAPKSDRAVTFGDLLLSHATAHMVYAERSDDGYSRMFSIQTGGGVPVSLCVRRDCYPLRWTADGAAILFVEGNSMQGDPTALMRVAPTGASRRLLVDGADR